MKIKGIWLYGYSGVGKTYISHNLKKKIKNPIIIDGDFVRKYISFDLDYSLKSRKIQIQRLLGIAKLVIDSNYFPIISCVYLDESTYKDAKRNELLVVEVLRPEEKYLSKNTYKRNKKNVVGLDIAMPILPSKKLRNIDINSWKKILEIIAK